MEFIEGAIEKILNAIADKYPTLGGIIILGVLGWLAYKSIIEKIGEVSEKIDIVDEKSDINYNEQLAQEDAMKKMYINGQTGIYEGFKKTCLDKLEERRLKLKQAKQQKKKKSD